MGQTTSAEISPKPDKSKDPTFDPHYGFTGKRKERVMKATPGELDSMKVPLERRDYCAHLWIKYNACTKDVWPLAYKCKHDRHVYQQCQYEDQILQMKEHEREKRLLAIAHNKELESKKEEILD